MVSDCMRKMKMLTNFSMKGRGDQIIIAGVQWSLAFTLSLGYISLHLRTLFQIPCLPCPKSVLSTPLKETPSWRMQRHTMKTHRVLSL